MGNQYQMQQDLSTMGGGGPLGGMQFKNPQMQQMMAQQQMQNLGLANQAISPFQQQTLGIQQQNAPRKYIEITETIEIEIPEKKIKIIAEPADHFSAEVVINFETEVLGEQTAKIDRIEDFTKELSPCRTFVFLHELELI